MIKVKTFGEFQMQNEAGVIVNEESIRSDIMTKFLIYLLLHRDKVITKEELIENLWNEDEIDNPAGALKNIIYRVRTFLKNELGRDDFITSARGSYSWNEEIAVELDVEKFDAFYEKARNTREFPGERILNYEELFHIYQGNFARKISDMTWVVNMAAFYQSEFLTAAAELCELYKAEEQYSKMEEVGTIALKFDNLNDVLYSEVILALIRQNKRQLAEELYNKASMLLKEELGIVNSVHLQGVHEELLKMSKGNSTDSMIEVYDDMQEEMIEGAFQCGYPIFREIYRLEARKKKRFGNTEYVMLITLDNVNRMDSAASHFFLKKAMKRLEKIMNISLRVGDVVSQYSDRQFIMLLPSCTQKAVFQVAERITRKYEQSGEQINYRLRYNMEEVMAGELEMIKSF